MAPPLENKNACAKMIERMDRDITIKRMAAQRERTQWR